ncbi:MAG: hypothetical protein AAGI70_09630 [Pseudomonadota bacterium]
MGPYYDTAITHHWPELTRAREAEMNRPQPRLREGWPALAFCAAMLLIGAF